LLRAKWGFALREKYAGAAEVCTNFVKLIKFEWSVQVFKQAFITLQKRKFNAEKSLPEHEDLVKLIKHIKDELKKLKLKDSSYQTFRQTENLAQARLLIFNKRRSGEVEVIRYVHSVYYELGYKILLGILSFMGALDSFSGKLFFVHFTVIMHACFNGQISLKFTCTFLNSKNVKCLFFEVRV